MKTYKRTIISCFFGIFNQALVCNLTPLLFIPLMNIYKLSYAHLGILVAINFFAQVSVDILFCNSIDKLGYKKLVPPAIALSFIGLILFAFAPTLFPNNVFIGIVIATVVFAASSGLLELLLSPMIDAMPSNNKSGIMSLMHSFYAWGQVATIVLTTLLIFLLKAENWQYIVLIWSVVPLATFFMFLKSNYPETAKPETSIGLKKIIFKPFYLLALSAIFFGAATEVVMNQWTSTFAEKALDIPKVAGDLFGMCGFAIMLGVGRVIYGIKGNKINMLNALIGGSILSIVCYVIVVISPFNWLSLLACCLCGLGASLLWPGTLVISSEHYPMAGAWLFAILAAAGDIGAGVGNWVTGEVINALTTNVAVESIAQNFSMSVDQFAIRCGIAVAVIFPTLTLITHLTLKRIQHKKS